MRGKIPVHIPELGGVSGPVDDTRYVVRRYGRNETLDGTPLDPDVRRAVNAALSGSMRGPPGTITGMIPDEESMVQVGEFLIGKMANGSLWLQKIDAEGMEVTEQGIDTLSQMLLEFFRENF